MPMDSVPLGEAISKRELHGRFRDWLANTDEKRIGPTEIDGWTAWIHVRDRSARYKFNADTKRKAVEAYLRLIDQFGDDLEWTVVPNQKGNMNAVAFGPNQVRVPGLYLYLVKSG